MVAPLAAAFGATKSATEIAAAEINERYDAFQAKRRQRLETKAIDAMHDALWTPKDFVGYDHVTERVMDVLYAAQADLSEPPGPNSQRKLALARAQVDDMVAQVDAL